MTELFLALVPWHRLWLSFRFVCPLVKLCHVLFGVAILIHHTVPEVWIFVPAVFAARIGFCLLRIRICVEDFDSLQAAFVYL